MKAKHNVFNSFPRGRVAIFVTGNIHKFNEARRLLAEYRVATVMLRIGAVEIQDDNLEVYWDQSLEISSLKLYFTLNELEQLIICYHFCKTQKIVE